MLENIAMYVLDIVNNSIRANGKNIIINICDNEDVLLISVEDDGIGIKSSQLELVSSPFYTSRETRNIGLGISLLKQLASQCNGIFLIQSEKGQGTLVQVELEKGHLDIPPMGSLSEMLVSIIQAEQNIDYIFNYNVDQVKFSLDTKEVKKNLIDVNIKEPSVLLWLKDFIEEGLSSRKEQK